MVRWTTCCKSDARELHWGSIGEPRLCSSARAPTGILDASTACILAQTSWVFLDVWHSLATGQLFDTTPHRRHSLATICPRPATPEQSHLGSTHSARIRRNSNRSHGLSRARHPFRGCDGANHKIWTGRLYTDSLARSHAVFFRVSAMRMKHEQSRC